MDKEKYIKLGKMDNEDAALLKDCLKVLPTSSLNQLYDFYNVLEEEKKTKQAKINYLYQEIPSQFLDDFMHMMSKSKKQKLVDIINNKKVEIDNDVINLIKFGYVYITPSGRLIVPDTLYYFLKDFKLIVDGIM